MWQSRDFDVNSQASNSSWDILRQIVIKAHIVFHSMIEPNNNQI